MRGDSGTNAVQRLWIFPMCTFFLLFGNATFGDSLDVALRIRGPSYGQEFGKVMAGAGDVDGDGLSDFLVGNVPDALFPGQRCCLLWLGSSFPADTADHVIHQTEEDPVPGSPGHFGEVVDGGSDVNGDGFDDMIITNTSWVLATGKVYLYYGGDPLDVEPDLGLAAWSSTWMSGFWATGLRGRLVGDVNGDQYDELVCLVFPYAFDGGAHVYFGGAPMDTIHDVSLQGVSYDTLELGSDIARGDVNGDGYGDLVVGAAHVMENPVWRDAAWVFYGGPNMDEEVDVRLSPLPLPLNHDVCIPGDLNGDGYDDVVAALTWPWPISISQTEYRESYDLVNIYFGGPSMDGEVDLQFNGRILGGYFSLAGGDLNLDGFPDVIVGENSTQSGGGEGRIAVYFGGAQMDTFPDFEIYKPGRFGETLAWIGDMTGDGWPEFAVSNPSGAGEIYIYTMGEVSGDGPNPYALKATGLRIAPNPSSGMMMIGLNWDATNKPEVRIYDLAGHLIRRIDSAHEEVGYHWVLWDGRNASGSLLPGGTYVVRAQNGYQAITNRIIVTR